MALLGPLPALLSLSLGRCYSLSEAGLQMLATLTPALTRCAPNAGVLETRHCCLAMSAAYTPADMQMLATLTPALTRNALYTDLAWCQQPGQCAGSIQCSQQASMRQSQQLVAASAQQRIMATGAAYLTAGCDMSMVC